MTLIVVNLQNKYLKDSRSNLIIPSIQRKLKSYLDSGQQIIFIGDKDPNSGHTLIHSQNNLYTIPLGIDIPHCLHLYRNSHSLSYPLWGYEKLQSSDHNFELIGLYTDQSIISEALSLKSSFPDSEIYIDKTCCLGTTKSLHSKALSICEANNIHITQSKHARGRIDIIS